MTKKHIKFSDVKHRKRCSKNAFFSIKNNLTELNVRTVHFIGKVYFIEVHAYCERKFAPQKKTKPNAKAEFQLD
jgi:hypothetical protein